MAFKLRMSGAGAGGEERNVGVNLAVCPTCRGVFRSFAGRRLHERRAHAEAYHAAEAERLDNRPRARRSPEEVSLMVAYERDHLGEARMNELIQFAVLPHRTLEGIKGKRRTQAYKSLLAGLDVQTATPRGDERPQGAASLTPPRRDRLTGGHPAASEPPPNSPMGGEEEDPSASVVPPPPPENPLIALGLAVRELSEKLGVEVPETLAEIQTQLDIWSPPPLVPAGSAGGRGGTGRVPLNSKQRRRQEYALYQKSWAKDRGRTVRRVIAGLGFREGEEEKPEGTTGFWKALFQRHSLAEVPAVEQ